MNEKYVRESLLVIISRKHKEYTFTILRKKQEQWFMLTEKDGGFIEFNTIEYEKIGINNGTLIRYWNEDDHMVDNFFENKFLDLNLLRRIVLDVEKSKDVFKLISKYLKS